MTIVEKLVNQGLTEEQATKIADNFGSIVDGLYIPKKRFDEVNNELKSSKETIKERDAQLETIQKSSDDVETLKESIKTLQLQNAETTKQAELTLLTERKNNAIKFELNGKAKNSDIVMSQLKLDEIIMNEDGTVKSGLKEQITEVQKTLPYLFNEDTTPTANPINIQGATPKSGDSGSVKPTNVSAAEMFAKSLAQSKNGTTNNKATNYYFGEK